MLNVSKNSFTGWTLFWDYGDPNSFMATCVSIPGGNKARACYLAYERCWLMPIAAKFILSGGLFAPLRQLSDSLQPTKEVYISYHITLEKFYFINLQVSFYEGSLLKLCESENITHCIFKF